MLAHKQALKNPNAHAQPTHTPAAARHSRVVSRAAAAESLTPSLADKKDVVMLGGSLEVNG